MKLQSDFAILDVKRGRGVLLKKVGGIGTGVKETSERVPVTVTGFIVRNWGQDDGTSREFEMEITKVEVTE